MTPTIADRLDSLIQAMTDIVLPAVDPAEVLAHEQAGLVIAHLRMIRTQLPLADRFETVEFDAAIALGRDLLPRAKGGALTGAVRDRLAGYLDAPSPTTSEERRQALSSLNNAMEDLVRAGRIDGESGVAAAIAARVLAATQAASRRDRIWFNGSGFDAEEASLPPRSSILTGDGA